MPVIEGRITTAIFFTDVTKRNKQSMNQGFGSKYMNCVLTVKAS